MASRPSRLDLDEARRLYGSDLSFSRVGQILGYSATSLARRFKAAVIPVRPSSRPLGTPAPEIDLDGIRARPGATPVATALFNLASAVLSSSIAGRMGNVSTAVGLRCSESSADRERSLT